MRRRAVRPSVPLGDTDVPALSDDHEALERRLDIRAALARLPEPQREAIVLVDLQDLSVAEAAAYLGVAEGTVKSRCSRGRVALARLLTGRREEEQEEQEQGGNLRVAPRVAPADAPGRRRAAPGSRREARGEEGERGHARTTP
jgi:RNA polymerase sigma-70 factor (ECF subfamily)